MERYEQQERKNTNKTFFGFWVYLMTDLLMFAALFATYAVLRTNTFGAAGPGSFHLTYAFIETLVLLTSSFTCGLGMLAANTYNKKRVLLLFSITFLLGVTFLTMELTEFSHLVADGSTWQKSAFLSSFFTLVGTHGLHILFGLFWMMLLLIHVARKNITPSLHRKLTLLSLFWHFLDIVWIFIFTMVYLMGAL